jgi:hypothetical protein
VGHLRENGFEVDLTEVDNIADFQEEHGIPEGVRGCHSAQVGDYRIEGHVPADLLKRFLEEDAGQFGISVPGMVVGPPGMEGAEPVPFDVITFDEEGNTELYESRPGNVRGN